MGTIADYVIDLVEEILQEPAEREKRFDWARGDPSSKTGVRTTLPFDAVWESRRLIIEVDEDQHRRTMPFWDKPDIMTVSGVARGEQRRIYDERKRRAAREAGYVLIGIPWERHPGPAQRNPPADRRHPERVLREAGVTL